MAPKPKWPTLEVVEDAELGKLLDLNEKLPAPEEGTDHHAVLVRIVARLRGVQAEHRAAGTELPQPDHAGWPTP